MLRRLAHALRHLVYPRHCPLCSCPLDASERSVCLVCLTRLPIYNAEAIRAHERLESVEYFGHLYAALGYHKGGNAQLLIRRYKHQGRIELAELLADLLLEIYPELPGRYDYLLAVPMTAERLRQRGYNQAYLLAQALARRLGGRASERHLVRASSPGVQSDLGKWDRYGNAQSTFALDPKRGQELRGRRLLIVDDILTSGATATAMLEALRPLEPSHVDVCVGCVAE